MGLEKEKPARIKSRWFLQLLVLIILFRDKPS